MIEVLLDEFRAWNRDWNNYNSYLEYTTKPPTKEEFIYYLTEKYPELKKLEELYAL